MNEEMRFTVSLLKNSTTHVIPDYPPELETKHVYSNKDGDDMGVLQDQIENASRSIFTDSYSMSIGELMSMYKEREIDVHGVVRSVSFHFPSSVLSEKGALQNV